MLKLLPKMRILVFLLTVIFLYIIPLGFTGWLNGESDLIFTTLTPEELYPLSYFTTVFEHNGNVAVFIPFRLTYIGCLTFAGTLVSLVQEVIKLK